MNSGTHASVMGNRKNKAVVETVAQIVFTIVPSSPYWR